MQKNTNFHVQDLLDRLKLGSKITKMLKKVVEYNISHVSYTLIKNMLSTA